MNKSSFFIVGQHAVIEALKNPKRKVLRVFLTEESKKNIHRKNQIILGIGASGDNKRWPTDYFCKLIEYFKGKNFEFILAGGPGEKEIINSIKQYHSDTASQF